MDDLSVKAARDLIMTAGADETAEQPAGTHEPEQAPDASTRTADDAVAEALQQVAGTDTESPARPYDPSSVGLGVDIVEIARMADVLQRTPSFAERAFSEDERAYCDSKADPATHYALRFAAKEAVVKALGTGFADGIWVRDVEVRRTKSGKPLAHLSGRALEVAEEQGVRDLTISLSYTRTDAVACAMAITESAMRASEKRKDPMQELARQFKETRGILDEL